MSSGLQAQKSVRPDMIVPNAPDCAGRIQSASDTPDIPATMPFADLISVNILGHDILTNVNHRTRVATPLETDSFNGGLGFGRGLGD